MTAQRVVILFAVYREWDLNPHSHHWPKDFKSFVSTYSTIAADKSGAKVQQNLHIRKFSCIFLLINCIFQIFVVSLHANLGYYATNGNCNDG